MQKLLNDPNQKFDVIIIDWVFSEYLSGLSAVFDCPYIWLSPYDPHWTILILIDEAANPAYVPDTMSFSIPPFNFMERLQELWNQMRHRFYAMRNQYIFAHDTKMYEQIYGPILYKKGRPLPSYTEVRYNASLVLGNSHVSMGLPIALPQNYKPIGGYFIDPNNVELPKELKTIMDDAKHGVIYFSMGTLLRGETFPEVVIKGLLQMFQELNQTILWKFEKNIDDVPKNIHILKWAPQQSILAHQNCRIFVTHGGMLSTNEAVYFGVPIIGVPMVGDQYNNINKAARKGMAKKVHMSFNFAEDLKIAISELLHDSRYYEAAEALSALYHDRPIPPGKELVFWVEHVARTRGAVHLRSPALLVPWYQKMYLDFIVLMIICLLVTCLSLKKLFSVTYTKQTLVTKKYK